MATAKKPKTSKLSKQSKRGGRRVGAGRKLTPTREAIRDLNATVDNATGEMVMPCLGNLKRLADGGYQRVSETMELASSVVRRDVLRDKDGNPVLDRRDRPIYADVPAYPDAQPGEMVVTKRVVETADADRAANEYLINRRLGKPKQAVEMSGPEGGAIPLSIEQAIDKIYGAMADDE